MVKDYKDFFWGGGVTQERVHHRKLVLRNLKLTSLTKQPENSFPLKLTKTKEEKPKELPKVGLSPSQHPKSLLLQ